MFKLGLEKAEEPDIKLPTFAGSFLFEFQRNIYLCFIHYTKAFDCVEHDKLQKTLKVMGIQDHLTWETCMKVKKQQLEPCMEKLIG